MSALFAPRNVLRGKWNGRGLMYCLQEIEEKRKFCASAYAFTGMAILSSLVLSAWDMAKIRYIWTIISDMRR